MIYTSIQRTIHYNIIIVNTTTPREADIRWPEDIIIIIIIIAKDEREEYKSLRWRWRSLRRENVGIQFSDK